MRNYTNMTYPDAILKEICEIFDVLAEETSSLYADIHELVKRAFVITTKMEGENFVITSDHGDRIVVYKDKYGFVNIKN